MKPASRDEIEEMIRLLEETPRRLAAACQGQSLERLHARPNADTWSANEILAHLRACADVWGKSIETMIGQEHPTLRYISPRTYARKTKYPALVFHLSFEAFANQRRELLARLRDLPDESWQRGATFLVNGQAKEGTVFSYARRLALHEHGHCEQFEALLRST